jgi:hypothetical protein
LEQILDLNAAPVLISILALTDNDNNTMSDGAGTDCPFLVGFALFRHVFITYLAEEVTMATEVQIEAAWVLTYLSAHLNDILAKVLADLGLLPLLVRHLESPITGLVIPILRTVGNIIARSDPLTELFLAPSMSPPLIPILRSLLSSSHRAIQKEATYLARPFIEFHTTMWA